MALMPAVVGLAPFFMPSVPRTVLNPKSVEYFVETRSKRIGMSLEQFEKEKANDQTWEAMVPKLQEMAALLKANGGPFVMGKTGQYFSPLLLTVGLLHAPEPIQDACTRRLVCL